MSEIYLIRHGQASFGKEEYDQLSDIGFRQAQYLGRHLALFSQPFDAIYIGTLNRQRQTAETVLSCFEHSGHKTPSPRITEAFDEYDFFAVWKDYLPKLLKDNPDLECKMKNFSNNPKEFQSIFSHIMLRWISGEYQDIKAPRWKDFKSRVAEGMEKLMKENGSGRRIVVFTSGGPIALVVQQALKLSDEKTIDLSWQVMNASITRIKYKGNRTALAGFNDITSLEMAGDKELLTYR